MEWLEPGLAKYGFRTGKPIVEDWGWVLPVEVEGARAFVGCSTPYEAGQKEQECNCTISVTSPLTKRLFGSNPAPAILAGLRSAIEKLIQEHSDIRNPEWSEK